MRRIIIELPKEDRIGGIKANINLKFVPGTNQKFLENANLFVEIDLIKFLKHVCKTGGNWKLKIEK